MNNDNTPGLLQRNLHAESSFRFYSNFGCIINGFVIFQNKWPVEKKSKNKYIRTARGAKNPKRRASDLSSCLQTAVGAAITNLLEYSMVAYQREGRRDYKLHTSDDILLACYSNWAFFFSFFFYCKPVIFIYRKKKKS